MAKIYYDTIRRAINTGDYEDVRRQFTARPEFLRSEFGTDHWMYQAAMDGDLTLLQLLLDLGLSIDEPNDLKVLSETPLVRATSAGRIDVVRWFLDRGARINWVRGDQLYCPALLSASIKGHLDVVKLLVENGANIHGTCMSTNAVMHAENFGQTEVAEYLRSLGARDLREFTPQDNAAAHRAVVEAFCGEEQPADWQVDLRGDPHIVIRMGPPNEDDPPERRLFTVGLSDRRLPTEHEPYACAEIGIVLPADWPLDPQSLKDPRWSWPVEGLCRIATDLRSRDKWPDLPVLYPNGDPPKPFAPGTALCGWLCIARQGASVHVPKDARWVDFHDIVPVYAEEMDFVRKNGDEALASRLHEHEIPVRLDPQRPNVAIE